MCLSLVWPELECCPSCSGSCGDTAGVNTGHSWALLALRMVKTLNFGLCAKTGSGVCSQMGESAICKENKQGAFKIWVPQQICRGVMESYSWAGDFILGVAKQCYSVNHSKLWGAESSTAQIAENRRCLDGSWVSHVEGSPHSGQEISITWYLPGFSGVA